MKSSYSTRSPLFKTIVIGVLAILLFNNIALSQSKSEALDQLIQQYHDYGQFNGSVLIAQGDEVIYENGFGMADLEWSIPNAPDTKHRIGSVTKQFTAMLILQLAAQGKLDLHAPITKYLPDYNKENGDRITIHHLLTHTAGIPNYTSFPDFFTEKSRNYYEPEAFVEEFSEKALEFTPGEKFSYSNSGYFLLGVILEKVSGQTYQALLRSQILDPLGMEDSGYDDHSEIIEQRATGYQRAGTGYVNAAYLDLSLPYAAGAMYATVRDLHRWDRALYTDKLLPQTYLDTFFAPHVNVTDGIDYAYGWMRNTAAIGSSTDSIEAIGHGGGINGFSAMISRTPSDASTIIVLSNVEGTSLDPMIRSIRGVLYDQPYDLPKRSLARTLLETIQSQGMPEALAFYQENKNNEAFEFSENEMNLVGYELMSDGHTEEAAQVFKLNVEAFPASSNVYDSYGEALAELGQREAAIENYKKSVEINPGNQNGIEMLKKLGVDTSTLVEDVVVPESVLATYVGDYELMPGFILTVSREGTQLKAKASGQQTFDVFPKTNTVFYYKVVSAQLKFNVAEDGEVESVTLFQNGQEITGKKLVE